MWSVQFKYMAQHINHKYAYCPYFRGVSNSSQKSWYAARKIKSHKSGTVLKKSVKITRNLQKYRNIYFLNSQKISVLIINPRIRENFARKSGEKLQKFFELKNLLMPFSKSFLSRFFSGIIAQNSENIGGTIFGDIYLTLVAVLGMRNDAAMLLCSRNAIFLTQVLLRTSFSRF